MNIYSAAEEKARGFIPNSAKYLYHQDDGEILWVFYMIGKVGYKAKLSSPSIASRTRNGRLRNGN